MYEIPLLAVILAYPQKIRACWEFVFNADHEVAAKLNGSIFGSREAILGVHSRATDPKNGEVSLPDSPPLAGKQGSKSGALQAKG